MPNTTNIDAIQWDGTKGSLHFALTSDGTALSDLSVLDLSVDLDADVGSIKVRSIDCLLNGNWTLIFEFDATTDQEIERIEGQSDVTIQFLRDYTDAPGGGKRADSKTAAGFTGDLILTSSGLASGDEFNLFMTFHKDSKA